MIKTDKDKARRKKRLDEAMASFRSPVEVVQFEEEVYIFNIDNKTHFKVEFTQGIVKLHADLKTGRSQVVAYGDLDEVKEKWYSIRNDSKYVLPTKERKFTGRKDNWVDIEESTEDPHIMKRVVKVHLENGDIITTQINGTKASINKYYLGQYLNMGVTEDDMVKVISVDFLPDSVTESNDTGTELIEDSPEDQVIRLAKELELEVDDDIIQQLVMGMVKEKEHGDLISDVVNITGGDEMIEFKIAMAHIMEIPDYYTRLEAMEQQAKDESDEEVSEPSEDEIVSSEEDMELTDVDSDVIEENKRVTSRLKEGYSKNDFVGNLGDVNWKIHGGLFVFKGEGRPFMLKIDPDESDSPILRYNVFEIDLDTVKEKDGEVTDIYDNVEWWGTREKIKNVAEYAGLSSENFIKGLTSDDLLERGRAYSELVSYFGAYEFDSSRASYSRKEINDMFRAIQNIKESKKWKAPKKIWSKSVSEIAEIVAEDLTSSEQAIDRLNSMGQEQKDVGTAELGKLNRVRHILNHAFDEGLDESVRFKFHKAEYFFSLVCTDAKELREVEKKLKKASGVIVHTIYPPKNMIIVKVEDNSNKHARSLVQAVVDTFNGVTVESRRRVTF